MPSTAGIGREAPLLEASVEGNVLGGGQPVAGLNSRYSKYLTNYFMDIGSLMNIRPRFCLRSTIERSFTGALAAVPGV